MEGKSPRIPRYGTTTFSEAEENVIGKFLVSCWNKKLKVPNRLLFGALKKHLDKYPRVMNRSKNNQLSNVWRKRFFARHPQVEDAYQSFKATSDKDYDDVSDQLLSSFVADLACVDKPLLIEKDAENSNILISNSLSDKKKKLTKENTDTGSVSSSIKSAKDATVDDRSVTTPVQINAKLKRVERRRIGHPYSRSLGISPKASKSMISKVLDRKSLGNLKLSSTLFKSVKRTPRLKISNMPDSARVSTPRALIEKTQSPAPSLTAKSKEVVKKKVFAGEKFTSNRRSLVAADAVPIEPIKYEEGANIEAMDCNMWYKAKIIEVDQKKQEILVHFNGWGKRHDAIFPMNSAFIRGPTTVEKKANNQVFQLDDDVLSQWTDGNYYPATIKGITKSGSYKVMYYDRFKKVVRPNNLKRMSEKEKEAALKLAQSTYQMPLSSDPSSTSQPAAKAITSGYRRYRTSANDREKRLARKASEDGNITSPTSIPKTRKRKIKEVLTTEQVSPTSTSRKTSPIQPGNFHAKQARLDKITGTLLNKAVTTIQPSTTTGTVSTGAMPVQSTQVVESSYQSISTVASKSEDAARTNDDSINSNSSDESDNPLIIDEDGDMKPTKPTGRKQLPSDAVGKKKKNTVVDKTSVTPAENVENVPTSVEDVNLRQLADAAVCQSSDISSPSDNVKQVKTTGPGLERQEASEALLQLAQSASGDSSDEKKTLITSKQASLPIEKPLESPVVLEKKMKDAIRKILNDNISVSKAASQYGLKLNDLKNAILQRPGVTSAAEEPRFMNAVEEDIIVNWIHDKTDLGWGIDTLQISQKIKSFLADQGYFILFLDHLPINLPSEAWMKEFLKRHPEIFPAREEPLSWYKFDRDGFEDWIGRWLATVRSSDVIPNAVYYCDETVWDATPKLLHEVRFFHKARQLTDVSSSCKITTLSCIGADGRVIHPFHIFPDNSNAAMAQDKLFANFVGFTSHGLLNSSSFFIWLKTTFLPCISKKKRPLALLVDTHLEMLNFETLKFAEENQIILYRFLPAAAHFVQHPDQKLFGRLRIQWKKALCTKFMEGHSRTDVSTHSFASYFKNEFTKIATSSNIKMCFELTKLYSPVPEPAKEEKNSRTSAQQIPHTANDENEEIELESGSDISGIFEDTDLQTTSSKRERFTQKSSHKIKAKMQLGEAKISLRTPARSKSDSAPSKAIPEDDATQVITARTYKKGETVLAKWSDCKLYSATILKTIDAETYKIRYYDGLVKVVNQDFLRPWKTVAGLLTSDAANTKPSSGPKSMLARTPNPATGNILQRRRSDGRGRTPRMAAGNLSATGRRHSLQSMTAGRKRHHTSESATTGKSFHTRSRTTSMSGDLSSLVTIPRMQYKVGDQVLCRWTDRRMYPATLLKQTDEDHYLVKYYDNRKKTVPHTWLSPWKPPSSDAKVKTLQQKSEEASKPSIKTEDTSASKVESGKPKKSTQSTNLPAAKQNVATDKPSVSTEGEFRKGDHVLARWTDCRSYPATVLKYTDEDHYAIQYYDGMIRNVKTTMLKKWDPDAAPKQKSRPGARERAVKENKANETQEKSKEMTQAVELPGGKPSLAVMGQDKIFHSYEEYYSKLTQESELNKFKCRVPDCTKVFRTEAALKQHHKHYHQQRYKLRDQEHSAAQKRRAEKDDSGVGPAKRRVSADYYSSTKLQEISTSMAVAERPLRSRGGKPPMDVYRMQQGADVTLTSPNSNDEKVDAKFQLASDGRGEPYVSLNRTSIPSNKRRLRSNSGASRQSQDSASESKEPLNKDSVTSSVNEKKKIEVVNEDVIRCICGEEEELGFMMQCDACLTWQHGTCEGIKTPPRTEDGADNANQPEYICKICRCPPGVRESQRFLYNNDFLTKGKLPCLVKEELDKDDKKDNEEENEKEFQRLMLISHQLMDMLLKTRENLHAIKLKINIADPGKNNPLLHLWKETNLMDSVSSAELKLKVKEAKRLTIDTNTRETKEKGKRSPPLSEVQKTMETLVIQTVQSVSPRYEKKTETGDKSPQGGNTSLSDIRVKTENAEDTGGNRTVESTREDEEQEGDLGKQKIDEVLSEESNKMEVDKPATELGKHDAEKESKTINSSDETSEKVQPSESIPAASAESARQAAPDASSDAADQATIVFDNLWEPINIKRATRLVQQTSAHRARKPDDYQEEVVLCCRTNLLQHIHMIENTVEDRVTNLEKYVTKLERYFQPYLGQSPSSGTDSPLREGRLGELQNDLGEIFDDIDAVHRLLSAPSSSV